MIGMPEPLGLAQGDDLGLEVGDEDRVGNALHVADAPEVHLELLALALGRDPLARGEQLERAALRPLGQLMQPADSLRERLVVGQEAPQPALVDVRHPRPLGGLLHGVARLLLRADEEDRAATPGEVRRVLLRLGEQRRRLLQIDDVDPAALAEDVPAHAGVPTTGLVTEVHPGLQQVLDAHLLSHCCSLDSLSLRPAGSRTRGGAPGRAVSRGRRSLSVPRRIVSDSIRAASSPARRSSGSGDSVARSASVIGWGNASRAAWRNWRSSPRRPPVSPP